MERLLEHSLPAEQSEKSWGLRLAPLRTESELESLASQTSSLITGPLLHTATAQYKSYDRGH